MAALTSTIIAGVGAAMNAAQAIKSAQDKKKADAEAKRAIRDQLMLTEQNKLAGVQVPTMGYDLAQQNLAQEQQSTLNALQGAGMEALLGGVPQLSQRGMETGLKLGAQLQEDEFNRDVMVGNVDQGIEQRKAERLSDINLTRLQGAQAASAQAKSDTQAAMLGGLQAIGAGAESYLKQKDLYKNQPDAVPGEPYDLKGASLKKTDYTPKSKSINTSGLTSSNTKVSEEALADPEALDYVKKRKAELQKSRLGK